MHDASIVVPLIVFDILFFGFSLNFIEHFRNSLTNSFIQVLFTRDIGHGVHSKMRYVMPEAC